jgi:hypothetical protein
MEYWRGYVEVILIGAAFLIAGLAYVISRVAGD